jgi:chorismate synthase
LYLFKQDQTHNYCLSTESHTDSCHIQEVAFDQGLEEDGDQSTGGFHRETARAGGVEGGMTTGGLLAIRAAMKPLATLNRPVLETVDVATKESTVSFKERTDVTAVPAMGVVAESMVALVLANEALRKFGGDSVAEFVRNHHGFIEHLGETPSAAPGA